MRYEGNIFRPINEASSYILQCTVGCSHNRCTFCGMYKDKKYRVRSLDEIKTDIEMAKQQYGDVNHVFLADGDAIAMDTNILGEILITLNETFPSLQTVATYAGPDSTLQKSIAELGYLRALGLNRAYLGLESGDDQILQAINKGVTATQMCLAGQNLINCGFELFCIVQLGLGGTSRSNEHAMSIAEIVNKIKPQNLNILTFTPVPGTPMFRQVQENKFHVLEPFATLEEMKTIIENLNCEGIVITSHHVSNYLPLQCILPQDREKIVTLIKHIIVTRDNKYLRREQLRSL